MVTEELSLQPEPGFLDDVVFGVTAGRNDRGAFGFEGLGPDVRLQDAVGDQLRDGREVGTQGLRPQPAGDLRGMLGESRAEGVDEPGDFFLGAMARIPGEQGREQSGGSALRVFFVSAAAGQEDADARLGDRGVRLQDHPDAVLEGHDFEPVGRDDVGRMRRRHGGDRAAQGAEGDVVRTQPASGFPGQVGGSESREVLDAAQGPGEVVTDGRGVSRPAGQAMDVLLAVHHRDDRLPAHLGEFLLAHAALQQPVHDFGDALLDHRGFGVGFACPAAPGQTEIPEAESRDVDRMDQPTFLAEFAPEGRAVAGSEHAQEEVDGGAALVEETRDPPAGHAFGSADLAAQVGPTHPALRRLGRADDVGGRTAGETAEPAFGGGEGFLGGHPAADGQHHVARHVSSRMIGAQVVGGDPDEKVPVTDDRLPESVGSDGLLQHALG